MKLKNVLAIMKETSKVRVGTEDGQCWLADGEVGTLSIYSHFLEREVVNMYDTQGRDGNENCCTLLPATALIIEGRENGTI